MKRGICAGSFDPVTNGHMDIFMRASKMFDELFVGVFNNIKKKPVFSVEERVSMVEKAVAGIPNIKVISFAGLLSDYALANGIDFIVRGLRSVTDYECEVGNAQIVRSLYKELDTVFLLCDPQLSYISSSVVREILAFGGDISPFVPPAVAEAARKKMNV